MSGMTAPFTIFVPSQFVGLGAAPEKWSPSSGVKMKSVLLWPMPAALRFAKRSEGGVIVGKLLHVGILGGTEGAFRAESGPFVIVVSIRDVREHHRNSFF